MQIFSAVSDHSIAHFNFSPDYDIIVVVKGTCTILDIFQTSRRRFQIFGKLYENNRSYKKLERNHHISLSKILLK